MILDIVFEQLSATIPVSFVSEDSFSMDFGEITEVSPGDIPAYDGSYFVIPAFQGQTLETAGLLMREDVQIKQIPVALVSNNSGGTTVIIGG